MTYLLVDLLFGATETTESTLTWSIIYLLNYPDVMQKVQEEINRVLGDNGIPSMMDKQKMPYVEATCNGNSKSSRYCTTICTT